MAWISDSEGDVWNSDYITLFYCSRTTNKAGEMEYWITIKTALMQEYLFRGPFLSREHCLENMQLLTCDMSEI